MFPFAFGKIFSCIKHYKGNCRGSLIIKHLFTSEKEFDVHDTKRERNISTQQQKIKKNKIIKILQS